MKRAGYTLTIPLPTWTLNSERSGHWHDHRARTADFRTTTALLARNARIPHLVIVAIEATPSGPRIRQDVAACVGSVKAAIDGLVDAGVIPDDTPDHVTRITFHPPRRDPHGLHLLIVDLGDEIAT